MGRPLWPGQLSREAALSFQAEARLRGLGMVGALEPHAGMGSADCARGLAQRGQQPHPLPQLPPRPWRGSRSCAPAPEKEHGVTGWAQPFSWEKGGPGCRAAQRALTGAPRSPRKPGAAWLWREQ